MILAHIYRLGNFLTQSKSAISTRSVFLSCRNSIPFNKKASDSNYATNNKSTLYYLSAIGVFAVGLSYAAVPLYRIFCQVR